MSSATSLPHLWYKRFNEIDLNDCFFDSLKEDYPGFDTWYNKKATAKETAFIQKDSSGNPVSYTHLSHWPDTLGVMKDIPFSETDIISAFTSFPSAFVTGEG